MEKDEGEIHLTDPSREEISDPLLTVARFFDDNNLPGQLELLKEWRRCVLTDEYFKGDRGSPSELLYFYRLNVSLIEAVYLLLSRPTQSFKAKNIQQLIEERNSWKYYPEGLTEAEQLDPCHVISSVFTASPISHFKQMLYDWLEHGLSSSAAGEFVETVDLIAFYENLQRLYAAAWLIYQRTKNVIVTNEEIDTNAPELERCGINSGNARSAELQKIVQSLITNHHPDEVILFGAVHFNTEGMNCFSSGEHLVERHYFLLMVTKHDERVAHWLRKQVITAYNSITVTILSCSVKRLKKKLLLNDRFFVSVLKNGTSLYSSGEIFSTRSYPKSDYFKIKFEAERNFEIHLGLAIGFLAATRSAMEEDEGNPGIAVYFLQQAVVQACVMLIKVYSGFKPNTRGLSKLLELCRCFESGIAIHFKKDTNEEMRLYQLLEHANSLYKDDTEASIADAESLTEQLDEFIVMGQVCCEQKIKEFEKLCHTDNNQ